MIELNDIKIGGGNPLVLLAGPCVVENSDITFEAATRIKEITSRLCLFLNEILKKPTGPVCIILHRYR